MTFAELVGSDKPVLIDFYADWCAPCRMMAPILEDVKKHFGEEATIYKLDVDRNPQVAAAYQVQSIPTMILFHNGEPVWRQSGVVPAAEIKRIIGTYTAQTAK